MLFKRLIRLAIILSVAAFAPHADVSAQSQTNRTSAIKFDEFGDVASSDKKARLDNFAVALGEESNTRGFLIVYRSQRDLPGLSSRLGNWMRDYLIYSQGIPASRMVTIDGGVSDCVRQELWLVPVGATPLPKADAYPQFVDVTSVRKFDEYHYPLIQDHNESCCDGGEGDSLDSFAAALRSEPRAQAYLIVYPQYYVERWDEDVKGRILKRRRVSQDTAQTTAKVLRSLRAEMVNKHHLSPARVKVVNGGYRKWRQVELWIVPRGEHAPIATPDAFPGRRR